MPCKLTGLEIHREVDPARASAHPIALIIDIDGLIWLNDYYGFSAGHQAIAGVAKVIQLRSSHFPNAHVSRVGGDEFLVLLPGTEFDEAHGLAQSIVDSVTALAIDYRRQDEPKRTILSVNVVVFRVTPAMITVGQTDHRLPIWDWFRVLIYEAKIDGGQRTGLVVNACEAVWSSK